LSHNNTGFDKRSLRGPGEREPGSKVERSPLDDDIRPTGAGACQKTTIFATWEKREATMKKPLNIAFTNETGGFRRMKTLIYHIFTWIFGLMVGYAWAFYHFGGMPC
jgi:hypothetical protein